MLRALCEERARDWMRFKLHLGLEIVQLTGDREANYSQLSRANIIMSVAHASEHRLSLRFSIDRQG